MGHVEYIEKLIEVLQKEFAEEPHTEEDILTFRKGVIYGMKYVVQALKHPIDFDEQGE